MKEELITDVIQQMLPYLDNAQIKRLTQAMEFILFRYEVTSAEERREVDDSKSHR